MTVALIALLAATILPPPFDAPTRPVAITVDLRHRCDAVDAAARALHVNGQVLVSDTASDCTAQIGDPGYFEADDPWRWASVTKQVVAVAVMQAVDAGKVGLDTPIATYVPALKVANADTVTLRMLLQHTSGLANVEDGPVDARKDSLIQYRRDAAPLPPISPICLGPAKAAPGARFDYNNCDTEIVGAVLEAVTHQRLGDLLRTTIFGPLGMAQTGLIAPGEPAGHPGTLANGGRDDFIDIGRFGAAGALAGSPRDLAKFDRALMSGTLLKPASRDEMWRGDPKLGYAALGQWVYTVPLKGCAMPQKLVERRGEIGGVQVRNVIAPDRGLALIVLTDRPFDFAEAWQGKGGSYDLFSAAFCPEPKP
jgi:CubicO group peptidase (beta-lactamase class C family)